MTSPIHALDPNPKYALQLRRKLWLFAMVMLLVFPLVGYGQTPQIELNRCLNPGVKSIDLIFKIKNASEKRIRVIVSTDVYAVTSSEIKFSSGGEHALTVNLLEHLNTIKIIGFANDEPKELVVTWAANVSCASRPTEIKVNCDTKWCYETLTAGTVASPIGEESKAAEPPPVAPAAATATAPTQATEVGATSKKDNKSTSHISITKPTEDEGPIRYQDVGQVPMEIRVDQKPDKKDNIKSVAITVLNDEGPVEQKDNKLSLEYAKKTGDPAVLQPDIRVGKGSNTVTVFDPKDPKKESTSVKVICEGEKCGELEDDNSPVDRFSSIYTRGIVGFEQSGGSAAQSVQKPFLEFFWNPPVWTNESQNEPYRYIYPKVSLWGSARFTSVPQQVSTPLATFAPSFLAPINETKVNELVQGFDFLFGGEMGIGRGFSKGDIGTAFLPTGTRDTKQKYSAYLFAGFGASSPLSPKESVAIFQAPKTQTELDKIQPGLKLPDGTQYIAFAGPDRDSFFRQWYAGVRLKTHYFHSGANGKLELINRPGGMFDIGVGQNEAVSGGRLHGMVMRFDGFYPLPVSNRSILYLYGNAFIKLRKHATVTDPLILATAPSNITVPADNVFLITTEPSNRDLYRIGIGVNLIELFKGTYGKKPDKKE